MDCFPTGPDGVVPTDPRFPPTPSGAGKIPYDTGTGYGETADGGTATKVLHGGPTPGYAAVNLATDVTGVTPVANGGTNSSTALANKQLLVSAAGAIVELGAATNGQLPIGSTGNAPVLAAPTAANGLAVTVGPGSLALSQTFGTDGAHAAVGNDSRFAPPPTTAGKIPFDTGSGYSVTATAGSATQVLHGGSTPAYAPVTLTTDVTGSLPIANGGTNSATPLVNGKAMVSSGGAIVEGPIPAGSNTPLDVQTFIAALGTWTKPGGARIHRVVTIGPGGAGGSGGTGSNNGSGGGGGGGGSSEAWFLASELPSTVACRGGSPGTPGAAVSATSTVGNAGGSGTDSTFGTFLRGGAGSPGLGGFNGVTAAAAGGVGQFPGGAGGTGNKGSGQTAPTVPAFGAGGGGYGGDGITPSAGSSSVVPGGSGMTAATGGASASGATNAGNGSAGPASGAYLPGGGGGGGGGATGGVALGGSGGAGGLYGGGGGGGGSNAGIGVASGAGGAAGNGITLVETF